LTVQHITSWFNFSGYLCWIRGMYFPFQIL